MYIEESGTRGAPTIVFLHGAGTGVWMWTPQVEGLQDYHCLALDLPGHGKSNHIEWRGWHETADQVAEIIAARANNGRAHLVGLSLGGYLGLGLLAYHHKLIDRAVLSGITNAPMPNARAMMLQIRLMSRFLKSKFIIDLNMRMLKIPADAREEYATGMRAMSRQAFVDIGKEFINFHAPEAELRAAPNPTLIVAGEMELPAVHQAVATLPGFMSHAAGRIAPGASHGWSGEKPELFNAMVRAWLTDAPLPEALVTVSAAAEMQPA